MAAKTTLNSDQKEALKAIKAFLDHPAANVFVLKGYAGTGKTFLMQQLSTWLTETEQTFSMLAATGRAASVLKGKTGFATKTVHSELYNFSKVDGLDDSMFQGETIDRGGQMSMQFTTRGVDENKNVYIVDEASMLSGELTNDVLFATFGSGVLLNDFFEVVGNNKVIFVGDPCQLPPVGQSISPALSISWLNQQNRVAIAFQLTKIERTDSKNDILKLAAAIRQMILDKVETKFPRLPARNLSNVKLHPSTPALYSSYLERYKTKGVNGTLAIARSNKTVQDINRAIRRDLFGQKDLPLQQGDVLLVTQNNYSVPLTNGDFVIITELGATESRDDLHFQNVKVKSVATEMEYSLLLSLDALSSKKGTFTNEQMKSQMIDFGYRMRDKNLAPSSAQYQKNMLTDKYLNCLKATYGYAVTCHKAQGGEWDNVYLFLDTKMYGMPNQELLKWLYTAITRSRTELNMEDGIWIAK